MSYPSACDVSEWPPSDRSSSTLQMQIEKLQQELQQEIQYRQQVEARLRESQVCLRLLSTLSKRTATGLKIDEVIAQTLEQMGHYFSDRRITYAVLEQGTLREQHSVRGASEPIAPAFQLDLTAVPYYAQQLHHRQILIFEDCQAEPKLAPIQTQLQGQQIRSLLMVPLQNPPTSGLQSPHQVSHPALSVLCFDTSDRRPWPPSEIATLAEVADSLSLILQEARAQLDRQYAESQLRLLESVVVNANDAVVITEANPDFPKILYVNETFTRLTGYSLAEVLGQTPRILQGPQTDRQQLDRIRSHLTAGIPIEVELMNYTKTGEIFWVDLNIVPIPGPDQTPQHFVSIQRDITDRKQSEAKIHASLQEKEVLLKEIHHRVKNNLQVISSLLRLQSGHLKQGTTNVESAIAAFQDSQHRVRAMALVHEKLYQSKDLAYTDFASYLRSLVQDLMRSYQDPGMPVDIQLTLESIPLSLEIAIPCGLIINELVSNALKYAFKPGFQGIDTLAGRRERPHPCQIEIQFYRNGDGQFTLIVQDNGMGLPQEVDCDRASTLGLQLVSSLTQQIGGHLFYHRSPGTQFRITFADPHRKG